MNFRRFATYLKFALIPAGAYLVVLFIFLMRPRFESLFLFFVGNLLFMGGVTTFVFLHARATRFRETTVEGALSGHILSITAAATATVIGVILFVILSPGFFSGHPLLIADAPPNFFGATGKGLLLIILMDAGLGNTVSGFFAAVLTSMVVKRNQKGENNREPF